MLQTLTFSICKVSMVNILTCWYPCFTESVISSEIHFIYKSQQHYLQASSSFLCPGLGSAPFTQRKLSNPVSLCLFCLVANWPNLSNTGAFQWFDADFSLFFLTTPQGKMCLRPRLYTNDTHAPCILFFPSSLRWVAAGQIVGEKPGRAKEWDKVGRRGKTSIMHVGSTSLSRHPLGRFPSFNCERVSTLNLTILPIH